MRNKTRLPQFHSNFHYVKINGEAQLIESPYYDQKELCKDLGYTSMSFSWRITNRDLYKQAKISFDEIALHKHTGQRLMKYRSIRKRFKDLQKLGYFPTLENINENKTVKTK